MNIHGDRPSRSDAEALVRRRIAVSDLRHTYDAADLARVELRPIVHIATPCHSRHDRPYGMRQWGVFLDGRCIAYVSATRAGQLKLWPYYLAEMHYQIDEEAAMTAAERLAIYLEVAAALRATGERGSELAALLVEQLADELGEDRP